MISSNPMGKDYSDPCLSKRMSLLLLATDCWIHDRALTDRMEKEWEPGRLALQKARQESTESKEAIRKMNDELLDAELKARADLAGKLKMPGTLDQFLEDLGFSGNQMLHLARIIKGSAVGGVHVLTKKKAIAGTKAIKPRGKR